MSAHETFANDGTEGQGSSDRTFGFVFAVAFSVLGLSPLRHHQPMRLWALAIAAIFLALALVAPATLKPLNRLWTKFGNLLQKITNPIVMGVLFYGLITPASLLMKAFGKGSVSRGFDPNARTYWSPRGAARPHSETMKQQF